MLSKPSSSLSTLIRPDMKPRVKFWRKNKSKSPGEPVKSGDREKILPPMPTGNSIQPKPVVMAPAGIKAPVQGRRTGQKRHSKNSDTSDEIVSLMKAAEDVQERLMRSLLNIKDACHNMNNGQPFSNGNNHQKDDLTGLSDLSLTSPSNIVLVARFLICLSGLLIQPVIGVLLFVILFGMEIIAGDNRDTKPADSDYHK